MRWFNFDMFISREVQITILLLRRKIRRGLSTEPTGQVSHPILLLTISLPSYFYSSGSQD
jgi:hypothetical protein